MDDRTISLAATINAASYECGEFRGIFGRIEERLKALPPAQPGWIPCSTELPKESGEYQVTVQYDNDDYDVVIYEYNAYRKEWNDGDLYSGIVMAWQPKPKPWEGEKP